MIDRDNIIKNQPLVIATVAPSQIQAAYVEANSDTQFHGGFREPQQEITHGRGTGVRGAGGPAPPRGAEPGGFWKEEKYCGCVSLMLCMMGIVCVCCCPCDGRLNLALSYNHISPHYIYMTLKYVPST